MSKVIDGRFVIEFPSLTERQEINLSSSLFDLIIYYINHKAKVCNLLQIPEESITIDDLVSFWFNYVGKSEGINSCLSNPETVREVYKYVRKYYKIICSSPIDFKITYQVFGKRFFRTYDQAEKIRTIFEQAPNNAKYKKVCNYLIKNRMDADHINRDFAELVINIAFYGGNSHRTVFDRPVSEGYRPSPHSKILRNIFR